MDDFDFDGTVDVAVGMSISATNGIAFDYFLGSDDGIERSAELGAVQLVNPTFDPETEQIRTTVDGGADLWIDYVYEWRGDELVEVSCEQRSSDGLQPRADECE